MTREAYCLTCGPSEADERGCLRCRCAKCGRFAPVMLTVAATKTAAEQRLCSTCWRAA